MRRPPQITAISLLLVAGLFLGSCGESRPAAAGWEQIWGRATALIPDESTLGEDPSVICEDVLVALRREEERQFPTPDELIDETVRQWFEVAEGAFFDCPPADGGFPSSYEKLDELEAEVAAGLDSLSD